MRCDLLNIRGGFRDSNFTSPTHNALRHLAFLSQPSWVSFQGRIEPQLAPASLLSDISYLSVSVALFCVRTRVGFTCICRFGLVPTPDGLFANAKPNGNLIYYPSLELAWAKTAFAISQRPSKYLLFFYPTLAGFLLSSPKRPSYFCVFFYRWRGVSVLFYFPASSVFAQPVISRSFLNTQWFTSSNHIGHNGSTTLKSLNDCFNNFVHGCPLSRQLWSGRVYCHTVTHKTCKPTFKTKIAKNGLTDALKLKL